MLNKIKSILGNLPPKKVPRSCQTCQNWKADFEISSYGICNIKYDRFTILKIPLTESITVFNHECDEERRYRPIDQ
jgi:hypothetical protein